MRTFVDEGLHYTCPNCKEEDNIVEQLQHAVVDTRILFDKSRGENVVYGDHEVTGDCENMGLFCGNCGYAVTYEDERELVEAHCLHEFLREIKNKPKTRRRRLEVAVLFVGGTWDTRFVEISEETTTLNLDGVAEQEIIRGLRLQHDYIGPAVAKVTVLNDAPDES